MLEGHFKNLSWKCKSNYNGVSLLSTQQHWYANDFMIKDVDIEDTVQELSTYLDACQFISHGKSTTFLTTRLILLDYAAIQIFRKRMLRV